MSDPREWTIDDLREHLVAAVQLELTTIPPYLTALYSLHPGTNLEAELVIRSVVVEEMLHMTLAANVLNAVGGRPAFTGADAPRYPARLPYHDPPTFEVPLAPFSHDALATFLAIENPTGPAPVAPAEASPDAWVPHATMLADRHGYPTIGAFYAATETGLRALDARGDLFTGDPSRQVSPDAYYASGGQIIEVRSLGDALAALEEIVEQGEGELTLPPVDEKFDPDRDLAHYYRFNQLHCGRRYRADDTPNEPTGPRIDLDYTAVYPMSPDLDPKRVRPHLRAHLSAFDAAYTVLLDQLHVALDGNPDTLTSAVVGMLSLKQLAVNLLRIPLHDGSGRHAGPLFVTSDN
jgi:hypothetical protein